MKPADRASTAVELYCLVGAQPSPCAATCESLQCSYRGRVSCGPEFGRADPEPPLRRDMLCDCKSRNAHVAKECLKPSARARFNCKALSSSIAKRNGHLKTSMFKTGLQTPMPMPIRCITT